MLRCEWLFRWGGRGVPSGGKKGDAKAHPARCMSSLSMTNTWAKPVLAKEDWTSFSREWSVWHSAATMSLALSAK